MLVFWITLCLCVRSAERAGSPCRGYCFRYCMDGTVIRVPCCWSGTNIDTTTLNSVARLGSKISSEAVTHEREQGDRLKPAIKCHSSPFRWAKSTAPLASPTQQVRTPGFCYCWSVRLEQSPRPCPQPERHRSCFQAPAEEFFCSHDTGAPSALGEFTGDGLYKSTPSDFWLCYSKTKRLRFRNIGYSSQNIHN